MAPPLVVILDHQQGEEGDEQFEVEDHASLEAPPPSQPFSKAPLNEKPEGDDRFVLFLPKPVLVSGQKPWTIYSQVL